MVVEIVLLTFTSSSELDLVSLEVGLVLLNGNESLLSSTSSFGHGLSFDPNRSKKIPNYSQVFYELYVRFDWTVRVQ